MVRDARRCRAPPHEELRPHPEEPAAGGRLEGWILATVIASEAKQSISRLRKYGLLRRFTPRNDEKRLKAQHGDDDSHNVRRCGASRDTVGRSDVAANLGHPAAGALCARVSGVRGLSRGLR